ncbi:hypothetical protein M436DRAFT_48685 [Aureobasidium namibiae CBS 147.97]|uniref:Uncharacterized protein n=1 Tax=Aureobasidium namibiae CBS 147.97 TaxID=1043004 RepID=A0A074XD80_9PEZI|nr:uncharacterized protein M436DRAFT_48685 [Aureobasidium namibiae CBS 147.97]KEQ72576.1 hypothetical protein M436DRAFT_48685 [Aureobasidium namibiae CBS 147.97]
MVLSSLKRLSRALSLRDATTDATMPDQLDQSQGHMDRLLHIHHRSSPKASVYEHSSAHSATTLHNSEHIPTNLSAQDSMGSSDAIVQIMTIGDSVITVETHRRDYDETEETVAKRRKKSFGIRRVKSAPAATLSVPLHGSITTIESTQNDNWLRSWSFPLVNWKDLNLVRRMRRSSNLKHARKEARRGKASCDLTLDRQSSGSAAIHESADCAYPMMSGAYQESPSHLNLATDEPGISPRTSIHMGTGLTDSERNGNHPDSSNEGQIHRKDSHFHEANQPKERAAAELSASTRRLSSDERSSGHLAFLLRPIDWFKEHHASVFGLEYSDSSSSSASAPPSPTSRLSQPPRRTEALPIPHTRPAQRRMSLGSTRSEVYMEPPLHLPPGFEVPGAGQAGPADWLHRGWEEHYRQSAEHSHRACHPLAAARCLPTRAEEPQQHNVCQAGPSNKHPRDLAGLHSRSWELPAGWKGKSLRRPDCLECSGAGGEGHRCTSKEGACVTTITLGECMFAKGLEQPAE